MPLSPLILTPEFAASVGYSIEVTAWWFGGSMFLFTAGQTVRSVLTTSTLQKLVTSLAGCMDRSGSNLMDSGALYLRQLANRLAREDAQAESQAAVVHDAVQDQPGMTVAYTSKAAGVGSYPGEDFLGFSPMPEMPYPNFLKHSNGKGA